MPSCQADRHRIDILPRSDLPITITSVRHTVNQSDLMQEAMNPASELGGRDEPKHLTPNPFTAKLKLFHSTPWVQFLHAPLVSRVRQVRYGSSCQSTGSSVLNFQTCTPRGLCQWTYSTLCKPSHYQPSLSRHVTRPPPPRLGSLSERPGNASEESKHCDAFGPRSFAAAPTISWNTTGFRAALWSSGSFSTLLACVDHERERAGKVGCVLATHTGLNRDDPWSLRG
ncbi:hypothetical protein M8818_000092 [Zalaria obscura]|uniref:Uncharacterized protein n=1 Tax=Zalaria obscura TaxID=2024903 RepID=A0ACC3SQ44_9PEZI